MFRMFVDVDLSDLSIVEGNLEKEEVNNIDEQNKNNETLTHTMFILFQIMQVFKQTKVLSSPKNEKSRGLRPGVGRRGLSFFLKKAKKSLSFSKIGVGWW